MLNPKAAWACLAAAYLLLGVAGPAAMPDAAHAQPASIRIAQANVWPPAEADKAKTPPPSPAANRIKPAAKQAPRAAPSGGGIAVNPDAGNLSPPQNPESVLHAKNANLGPCMGAVQQGAATAITAPHSAFSNWNPGAPALHAFESIAIEAYPGAVAPRAAAVILASPAATGCDASTVQVFPSARPCAEIEKDFSKSSNLLGTLAGLHVYGTSANEHRVLMPTAGNGCVIVAVRVQYVTAATSSAGQPTPPAAAPSTPTPANK